MIQLLSLDFQTTGTASASNSKPENEKLFIQAFKKKEEQKVQNFVLLWNHFMWEEWQEVIQIS